MAIDILVIDDEEDIRNALCFVLEDEGYKARSAKNSSEALQAVHAKKPNLVVLDVWLNNSELDGIEILEELKKTYKDLPVIVISGHGTVDMAVNATKKGAYDFLSKPFKTDALLTTIARALETGKLVQENKALQDRAGMGDFNLIGQSKEIKAVRKCIEAYANIKNSVLIVGQGGTGKDVVASLLHQKSSRTGLYSVFNASLDTQEVLEKILGSINPRMSGVLEDTSAGTLVITNAEKLEKSVQLEFVKVLSRGGFYQVGSKQLVPLNTKLVFVCREISELDENLRIRLKDYVIKMPSLRQRISDMPIIAEQFMKYRAKSKGTSPLGFDDSAIVTLSSHVWEGNMWEFINVIDRLLLGEINNVVKSYDVRKILWEENKDEKLSFDEVMMLSMRDARAGFEKYYLSYHLNRFDGSVKLTADFIGMDRAALSRKIKSLELN